MKRLVVFGALALVVTLSCGGSSSSTHQKNDGSGSETGGTPGEAGESSGGTGAATGGRAGTGGGSSGSDAGGNAGESSGGTGAGGTGGASGTSGASGSAGLPCGAYDCTRLPHVREGAAVECRGGACYVPPDGCEENFAHCSTNASVGCEADLRSSETCGDCATACSGTTPACALDDTGWHCAPRCNGLTPDQCGNCTNVASDPMNCGRCGTSCNWVQITHVASGDCVNGGCVATGACSTGWGDCDTEFGCETSLDSPANCGACGRDDCGAAHASPDCSSPGRCTQPRCDAGYGNCAEANDDCESTYGGPCFPRYEETNLLATFPQTVAVAPDGSFLLGGSWSGQLDFDASSGVDLHTSVGETDAYITRFDATGSYASTLTFGGGDGDGATVSAMTIAATGSPFIAGQFGRSADLDPGPGEDIRDSGGYSAWFISKLSPAGNLVWARVLSPELTIRQLVTDADGAVYATGSFFGQVDMNPDAGTDVHDSGPNEAGFLLKLDAAGTFAWARSIEGADATSSLSGVAVTYDRSVYSIGTKTGAATVLGTSLGGGSDVVLLAFALDGGLRGSWTFETTALGYPQVAASGGVFATGSFSNEIDLDPGPSVETRLGPPDSQFLLTLSPTGTYYDAHVWPEGSPLHVAATDTSMALVGVPPNVLTAFYPDASSAWTLGIGEGGSFSLQLMAAGRTHVILVGDEGASGDYDPGPTVERVDGPAILVTRYAF